jgi:tungstate transport system substrate-binding protein
VIRVRHPAANAGCARAFAAWITGPGAQRAIGSFGVERFGEPLFVPASEDGGG